MRRPLHHGRVLGFRGLNGRVELPEETVQLLLLHRPGKEAQPEEEKEGEEAEKKLYVNNSGMITMNFKDVDLHVLIKFISELTGKKLDISGHPLEVGKSEVFLLSSLSTLFARYILTSEALDEEQFLESAAE
mgnify:CR=1 FL=1